MSDAVPLRMPMVVQIADMCDKERAKHLVMLAPFEQLLEQTALRRAQVS